jgi:hypothetical protein
MHEKFMNMMWKQNKVIKLHENLKMFQNLRKWAHWQTETRFMMKLGEG